MRPSGRKPEEVRKIVVHPSVLKEADGSALVRWGKNLVIAGVFGPRECVPKHEASPYRALLKVRYSMAPFSTEDGRARPGPTRRSVEISKVLRDAFAHIVLLENYPGTEIDVFMEVLRAEAGTRLASLIAGTVALVDAGIAVRDFLTGVAVGKYQGEVIVDLDKVEDNEGEADMPMALRLNTGEVVLLQMDGMMTLEEFRRAFDLGFEKATEIGQRIKEFVRKRYERPEGLGILDGVWEE